MHQRKASAYYVDSGTALKSVVSKLQFMCFVGLSLLLTKLGNLPQKKIHLDLNNPTHFHNSCGDKLDHTVY